MILVTIATGKALQDLKLLINTVETWYGTSCPSIYLYTDQATFSLLPKYNGKLFVNKALNEYTGLNRREMEQIQGKSYKTKWTDFMCEKINAMRWAFEEADPGPEGVWFLDADICLLAKLPEIPKGTDLALAPHYIRPTDESKYGKYNGGFLWMREPRFLDLWAEATHNSRFFEQAALENLAQAATSLYEFPIQNNFGWWRLFQSSAPAEALVKQFGFNRRGDGIGLTYASEPLRSVHTHFYEKDDIFTKQFNQYILGLLEKLGKHPPAQDFLRFVRKQA